MAEVWFQGWYDDLLAGNVSGADIRSLLVMTNTTCDTEEDTQTMAGFTTIDEFDGVGYQQLDHTVSSNAYDATDNRWEIQVATGQDWDGGGGSVAAGSRDVQGMVVYRYVDGTAANDIPWLYSDDPTAFPFGPNGGEVAFTPSGTAFLIIEPKP